jgi:hypothetical protein
MQDKDESSESLKQGIPVVSLSIGDTAEFAMACSYEEVGWAVSVRGLKDMPFHFKISHAPCNNVASSCAS